MLCPPLLILPVPLPPLRTCQNYQFFKKPVFLPGSAKTQYFYRFFKNRYFYWFLKTGTFTGFSKTGSFTGFGENPVVLPVFCGLTKNRYFYQFWVVRQKTSTFTSFDWSYRKLVVLLVLQRLGKNQYFSVFRCALHRAHSFTSSVMHTVLHSTLTGFAAVRRKLVKLPVSIGLTENW